MLAVECRVDRWVKSEDYWDTWYYSLFAASLQSTISCISIQFARWQHEESAAYATVSARQSRHLANTFEVAAIEIRMSYLRSHLPSESVRTTKIACFPQGCNPPLFGAPSRGDLWRPSRGDHVRMSGRNLQLKKTRGMGWKLHDPNFNRFRLIHPCDGQTDRQTDLR